MPGQVVASSRRRTPVATCACCGQQVALVRSTLVEHEFRPQGRIKTPFADGTPCPGSRFPSWEESSEGLEWILADTIRVLKERRAERDRFPKVSWIMIRTMVRNVPYESRIRRGDPHSEDAFALHEARLDSNIRALSDLVRNFERRLTTRGKAA